MSIPYLFRCPISLDLFTDPVTLSTGQTYDRPSIEKWLADGNLTCPVTMQRLADTTLIPNHTLRHLIDQWLLADAAGAIDYQNGPLQSAAVDADLSPLALKRKLQYSPNSWSAEVLESAKKVRALCVESDIAKACFVQLGFFPLLLQLLFQSKEVMDAALAEVMLDCVLSLAASSPLDPLNMLKEEANLASFVLLLDQGHMKIKTSLCHLLEVISSSLVTRELCLIIGRSRGVLQILVSLLRNESCARASEAAAQATAGLCSLESNRGHAVREGTVDGLVSHLSNTGGARRNASRVLATLEQLLEVEAGRKALVEHPNGIDVLVKMVFRVSSADHEGSEQALGALLVVCGESEEARSAATDAGAVTQVLLLLQSQCSLKAKARGRALLKLLRSPCGLVKSYI
ncbi:U-box domain-containing protein 26-like [Canna indica]|uniref:U-box domain-containing protein n=1 Tax=Canna indica TaxID=4628 RepID=A0AAQ3QM22_9LILI|nr:U-box domain-containing protein 26-like [Canna indica]